MNIEQEYKKALQLNNNGEYQSAAEIFRSIIAVNEKYVEAHIQLAFSYTQLLYHSDAYTHLSQALILDPCNVQVLHNIALEEVRRGYRNKGIAALQTAIKLNPSYPPPYRTLATYFIHDFLYDEALELLLTGLNLEPSNATLLYNIGLVLIKTDRYAEAIAYLYASDHCEPRRPKTYNNLAKAYSMLGFYDRAYELFSETTKIDPNYHHGLRNFALIQMLQGDYAGGATTLEKVSKDQEKNSIVELLESCPRWEGEDLTGKTLFVRWEFGLGDTLMYSRFLPQLHAMGATITFQAQPSLTQLFHESSYPIEELVDDKVNIFNTSCDYQVSLPALLKLLDISPSNCGLSGFYFNINKERAQFYKKKYFNTESSLKVAITWSGNPAKDEDRLRSTRLETFQVLFSVPNVEFYSFQVLMKETPEEDLSLYPLKDVGSSFNNFVDTAAALDSIDLLISVDTSTVHMAAALGIPVWVILPSAVDWRWGISGNKTPWYNSVELFRQKSFNNWKPVIDEIRERLCQLVHSKIA